MPENAFLWKKFVKNALKRDNQVKKIDVIVNENNNM